MQQQRRMTYQADTASRTRRIALFLCMLLSARCISFGGGGQIPGSCTWLAVGREEHTTGQRESRAESDTEGA